MAADRAIGSRTGRARRTCRARRVAARVGQRVVVRRRLPGRVGHGRRRRAAGGDDEPDAGSWSSSARAPWCGCRCRTCWRARWCRRGRPAGAAAPRPGGRRPRARDGAALARSRRRAAGLGRGAGCCALRGLHRPGELGPRRGRPGDRPAGRAGRGPGLVRTPRARPGSSPCPAADRRAPGVPPRTPRCSRLLAGAVSADGWVPAARRRCDRADGGRPQRSPGRRCRTAAGGAARSDWPTEPDPGWLGPVPLPGAGAPADRVAGCCSRRPEQVFVSVSTTVATVAVARGQLGGGWAGVTAVEVDPGYRRPGLAGALLARLAAVGGRRAAHGRRTCRSATDNDAGAAALPVGRLHRAPPLRLPGARPDPSPGPARGHANVTPCRQVGTTTDQ